jgi:hypothetical protein
MRKGAIDRSKQKGMSKINRCIDIMAHRGTCLRGMGIDCSRCPLEGKQCYADDLPKRLEILTEFALQHISEQELKERLFEELI